MKVNKRFADFVDSMNFWRNFQKKPLITFPLSQENADAIAARLESELSPENLTCDGELSRAQVKSRHTKLMGVAKDLRAYCFANGLRWTAISP